MYDKALFKLLIMCGIAGIISSNRTLDPILQNMKDSLIHRGPDNQKSNIWDNLGLVHTRLSIIDLSNAANQPMQDDSGRYALIYNGEIFNFKELKKTLLKKGIEFKTNSDTEVLLYGFIEEGVKFLKKIRGFYAFCIYDREDKKIILSRDFFGKKPLYFSLIGNEFVFASEIKAIKSSFEQNLKFDFKSLSHYLWKGYYANGDTAFEEVKSLKPGEVIEVSLKPEIISRSIDTSQTNMEISNAYPKRKISLVENALKESVSYRLISDVPVSFLLSGGVDSSLISSIASEIKNEKINTYFLGFNDKPDNFKVLAEEVSKKIKSNHQTYLMSSPNFDETIPKIIKIFDEPFADYSSIPSFEIYKAISENTKVAISGDGADEIFSGYKDSKLFYLNYKLPFFFINRINFLDLVYPLLDSKIKLVRLLTYAFVTFFANDGILNLSTNRGGWNKYYRKKFMTKEGYKLTGGDEVEKNELKDFMSSGKNSIERYLNYDRKRLSYDFLVKVDRSSMANSLEVRCPYLDKNIIHDTFPVNPSSMVSLRDTKKELKALLISRNLSNVTKPKKMGFTPPLESWILSKESKIFLKNMIEDDSSIIPKLFLKEKLLKIINNDKNIVKNKSRLWHLMILHEWYKENFLNNQF